MPVSIVFNNSTNSNVNFMITSSGGHHWAPINALPHTVASGTFSGAYTNRGSFSGAFYLEGALSTPNFTGDTEVTLAVFIQPNAITTKP